MLEAYKDFWKRYVDFKGKSNRLQFWTPVLIHIIVVFVVALIGVISFITGAFIISAILSVLVGIFGLAIIVPMIAVTLRRFYDAGKKRLSAIILIAFSVLINITFDIVQINRFLLYTSAAAAETDSVYFEVCRIDTKQIDITMTSSSQSQH
ncbi:DUF805 domain-containing protein, partial [Staphylococcus gallinarum]|uniref:DUF805 domain-containing protein n=1 Tax=Staphylococcus gallinarum TaxID=1293 RepID=UPI000FEE1027